MKSLTCLVLTFVLIPFGATLADSPELRSVKARTLELQVPADWTDVQPKSKMRAAQFSIEGEVDLVVFYFGGPTGGVKANVERWVGQFDKDDRKVTMTEGKCLAGRYILVDCVGTWNRPDGPPFAQKTIATPGSRVLNVIVIEEQPDDSVDYYFIKMSGKVDAVTKQVDALRVSLCADVKKETAFSLDDKK